MNLNDEQLRPHFPPRLPFHMYPARCPQCRELLTRLGPMTSSVGNRLYWIRCKNDHNWTEVT